jgi:hypothetical protein
LGLGWVFADCGGRLGIGLAHPEMREVSWLRPMADHGAVITP